MGGDRASGVFSPENLQVMNAPQPRGRIGPICRWAHRLESTHPTLSRLPSFYDRLLESFSGTKVGICFEEQLLEGVPVEPHDMAVDYLVTPSGILACAH
jgi:hypothetical protein